MPVRTYAPNTWLASRVAAIVVVESDAGENAVLPAPGAVMGIQYRGRIMSEGGLLSLAGVTGIQSGLRHYRQSEATGSVLVRFTAQGSACLGVPGTELFDRSVSLEDLLGRGRSSELSERLSEAPNEQARVAVVAQFVMSLPFANDALVARATELFGVSETATVEGVARELGISERQLERRFRARVGVSPKQYARLTRFQRAVNAANTAMTITGQRQSTSLVEPASLTAVAQYAGYYDQSHFVREVRHFTGLTPRELFSCPR